MDRVWVFHRRVDTGEGLRSTLDLGSTLPVRFWYSTCDRSERREGLVRPRKLTRPTPVPT